MSRVQGIFAYPVVIVLATCIKKLFLSESKMLFSIIPDAPEVLALAFTFELASPVIIKTGRPPFFFSFFSFSSSLKPSVPGN